MFLIKPLPPTKKVAEKLASFFLKEMEDFKRSPFPHTRAEIRQNKDLREAAERMQILAIKGLTNNKEK